MLGKLRNKMLIMNMVSTFCLLIIAFVAIFTITYTNIQHDINENLFRAFSFHRQPQFALHEKIEGPEDGKAEARREMPEGRALRDMKSFSVMVDENQDVITDSIFGENSEHYKTVAETALSQKEPSGEFKSENMIWRFDTKEFDSGARMIALVDITAEKTLLTELVISLLVCSLILLIVVFIVSFYFANRAIEPVKEAWEKQKRFVADASHELKTPLTTINANIDVLLSSEEADAANGKWLGYIKSEVERLNTLTTNLLLMAKMDNDTEIELKEESLSDIILNTALNFEAVAFEKGIELDCDIRKNISVKCNASLMTQLSVILLDNAVKYSPEKSCVRVRLTKNSHGEAAFSVHNFGEVIPLEEQEKIFDRFYRTDKSRSSAGYGLGLSMAKEIVNIHKGKICVSSSEQGTEFTVLL